MADVPASADRSRAGTGHRRRLALVGVPIAVLSALGIAAAAFTPVLVRDHPALLLVLESRNRYLLLVAAKLPLVVFAGIAVPRRLASDPFYFLLGRWYGERAVVWLQRRPGATRVLRLRAVFERMAAPLVFLFPGALVSVLAGAGGMSWRRFLVLNLSGSVAAVLTLWWLADRAAVPLQRVVAFNDRNAGWLTVATVAVVTLWVVASGRRSQPDPPGVEES